MWGVKSFATYVLLSILITLQLSNGQNTGSELTSTGSATSTGNFTSTGSATSTGNFTGLPTTGLPTTGLTGGSSTTGGNYGTNTTFFLGCIFMQTLEAELCVQLDYNVCNVTAELLLGGQEIFSQQFDVVTLDRSDSIDFCNDLSLLCSTCVSIKINASARVSNGDSEQDTGCVTVDLRCSAPLPDVNAPLGCFTLTHNNASCAAPPSSSSTSTSSGSGCYCMYGACVGGRCQCEDGYAGDICDHQVVEESVTNPVLIAVPIAVIIPSVIVAAILGWILYRRKKHPRHQEFKSIEG